jgi:hypothetical protein
MYHQTIVGKPKNCLNRNCKQPFFKESHLGWLPKSEIEVFTIMRCSKCKDTFAVVQLLSMAHDYKAALPKDPSQLSPMGPISKKEVLNIRKKLDNKESLKTLLEGYKPNGSVLSDEEPEE